MASRMKADRVYDRVAERYDGDWAGLYANARARCLEQIARRLGDAAAPVDVVDLGVGTGNALDDLRRRIELGDCVGFDLSAGMLEQARRKLDGDVRLIRDDASHAASHLAPGSADLVLTHFLLSFVEAERLIGTASELLRPGGLLSIATSTQRSLEELHTGRFERAGRLLGIKRSLRRAHTPRDHAHCLRMIEGLGFEVIDDHLERQAVSFESFDDVRRWALDSGWAASSLGGNIGLRIVATRLAFAVGKLLLHPLYPIRAVNEISIVLARKSDAAARPAPERAGAGLTVSTAEARPAHARR